MPALLEEMRGSINTLSGEKVNRVQPKVYDLDNEDELKEFAIGKSKPLKVFGTDKYVNYDNEKRVGIAISAIGASKAISLGAYNYALSQIDSIKNK